MYSLPLQPADVRAIAKDELLEGDIPEEVADVLLHYLDLESIDTRLLTPAFVCDQMKRQLDVARGFARLACAVEEREVPAALRPEAEQRGEGETAMGRVRDILEEATRGEDEPAREEQAGPRSVRR